MSPRRAPRGRRCGQGGGAPRGPVGPRSRSGSRLAGKAKLTSQSGVALPPCGRGGSAPPARPQGQAANTEAGGRRGTWTSVGAAARLGSPPRVCSGRSSTPGATVVAAAGTPSLTRPRRWDPGPPRPAGARSRRDAGRRPRPPRPGPVAREGSPRPPAGPQRDPHQTGPPRPPLGPRAPRSPARTPARPVPVPRDAYRAREAAAAAAAAALRGRGGRGARAAPAAGSALASSRGPGASAWSLDPAASARAARARLLCEEEKAGEGFKVRGAASAGGGAQMSRPAPPLGRGSDSGWGSGSGSGSRALVRCAPGAAAGRGAPDAGWRGRPPALGAPSAAPSSSRAAAPPGGLWGPRDGTGAWVPPEATLGNAGRPPPGERPELQHPEGRDRAGEGGFLIIIF